jgi:uncharacterized protein YaaQ
MKFLIAFVHEEDVEPAAEALRDEGFRFTALESSGGFLRNESGTFLLGLSEERLDECLDLLRERCKSRIVGAPGSFLEGRRVKEEDYIEKYQPATAEVGGAAAFVLDAERLL